MTEAYAFLRRLEHCLQMRLDEQTHTLPEDAALEVFARFAGFENAAALTATVTDTLQYVAVNMRFCSSMPKACRRKPAILCLPAMMMTPTR